jgi:murein DD-endopeptidase MepM/ murein hydrolase activator NlpD
MRSFFFLLLFCLSGSSLFGQEKYPQDYFDPPLNVPLISSGTFGELRGNHFHSGLDIKTQGKIGVPVLAAAEGTIVRIKVSPYGFGRALYMRHPNGYTTVYAHLHQFSSEMEAYVIGEMKRKQSNAVDLFPKAGQFTFAKGDPIAWSGNSGGSGGPHLHFEIRSTKSEKIINPLLFGFKIADQRFPELSHLQRYSLEDDQLMGQKDISLLKGANGSYSLAGSSIIEAVNAVSFGIYAIDKQDGANNKNGIYAIRLLANNELRYEFKMETFAFDESRFINSHIDYGLKSCCGRTSHKLDLEPGNQLSVYGKTTQAAIFEYAKDTIIPIRIEVSDVAGNVSSLNFTLDYKHRPDLIKKTKLENIGPDVKPNLHHLSFDESKTLEDPDYEIRFKANSFYRNQTIEIKKSPKLDVYSDLVEFGDRSIPVHLYYEIKLRVKRPLNGIDPSKLFIASYKNGKYDDYEGGYYSNGWIVSRTRQLGQFGVYLDTTAPTITAINFKDNDKLKPKTILQIRVGDDLSGIEEYDAWLNGVWVPMYYDAKTRRLLMETKYWQTLSAAKQLLKIRVEDDKQNVSTKIWELFVL